MTSLPALRDKTIEAIDRLQQKHRFFAVPYAVIKKSGDDHAGYLAAVLTYYGFVSLFPLLIVMTSVIQLVAANNTALKEQYLHYATNYFPAIGNTLADSINTTSKSGLALAIGLLIAFYGARGIAHAAQHALDEVWSVSRKARVGFPKSTLKSFGMIIYAGLGFLASAALTAYATASGHTLIWRLALSLAGFALLYGVYWGILTYGSSEKQKYPWTNVPGAALAAIGLLVLQALGSYIIRHQLKSQTGLNAQFALVLALLFWLYLQSQLFLYSAELSSVRAHRLWPRSLRNDSPTAADKKALDLYKERETFN